MCKRIHFILLKKRSMIEIQRILDFRFAIWRLKFQNIYHRL